MSDSDYTFYPWDVGKLVTAKAKELKGWNVWDNWVKPMQQKWEDQQQGELEAAVGNWTDRARAAAQYEDAIGTLAGGLYNPDRMQDTRRARTFQFLARPIFKTRDNLSGRYRRRFQAYPKRKRWVIYDRPRYNMKRFNRRYKKRFRKRKRYNKYY